MKVSAYKRHFDKKCIRVCAIVQPYVIECSTSVTTLPRKLHTYKENYVGVLGILDRHLTLSHSLCRCDLTYNKCGVYQKDGVHQVLRQKRT